MSKDPAFLFYSQDFIVGTLAMTFEDRGKYIFLLAQMHQQGRMDEETIRLLVGSPSVKLQSKFQIDEKGFWYNERLEAEMEKRSKFVESRQQNGKLGGRPTKKKKPTKNLSVKSRLQKTKPTDNLPENENIDSTLMVYIKRNNYNNILKLEPITQEQTDKIKAKYPIAVIEKVLAAMENRKDLVSKNKYIYLTLNNWCAREAKGNTAEPSPTTEIKTQRGGTLKPLPHYDTV
jgi:uncharacterized protein YdaU (DUF1376 family)